MKKYLQLSEEERLILEKNFLEDPDKYYKNAEEEQLRNALTRAYKERFLTMTYLMKLNIMLSKAKIAHGNFPTSK